MMDNPLTPKKIQKLINLAEGRLFNERLLLTEDEVNILAAKANFEKESRSPGYHGRCESSSGIIDLDNVETFGESGSNMNMSLSKSSTFHPGEITGRSTGTSEASPEYNLGLAQCGQYGRHSIAIDSITSQMDKQTSEINDLMRHSIASNYSFQSKRDLTADEASLIAREAPLPMMQQTHTYFADSMSTNTSNLSVGAYFKNRCGDFGKILGKSDSPDRSHMMPSITEVSVSRSDYIKDAGVITIDDTLDSVPVRQPRNTDFHLEKSTTVGSHTDQTNYPVFKEPARPKALEIQANKGKIPQHRNSPAIAHKSFMTSSKPTDILLKNLHSSLKLTSDDTEETVENSFSLSKIADYLGKQSNVSVTDIMQLQKRQGAKKQPVTEHDTNAPPEQLPVTKLVESKMANTASSAGTVQTVISVDNYKTRENKVPQVIVTHPVVDLVAEEEPKRARTRSKSPSSRSPSTLSTVRDNNYNSFKSTESPNCSNDEANRSKIPSPNVAYKELDKSVDWQEVLQQKRHRQRGVAKESEQWVAVVTNPVDGFVGVTTAVTISVTTVTDNWLTATFKFNSLPHDGKYLNAELPRLPLLLSPVKTEEFTFHLTSLVEMKTVLPFSLVIRDASLDGEYEQKGELNVNFKLPTVEAVSSDGLNKILYPVVPEKTAVTKTFVLINHCPEDLQLQFCITEGDSYYSIKNIQEIKKSDVSKVLLQRAVVEDNPKSKTKAMNKQLCRLGKDNAISVTITFNSPKLDMSLFGMSGIMTTYNGCLEVSLIGSNIVLKSVALIGLMGIPKLHVDVPGSKIHINSGEPTKITVSNRGTVVGTWAIRCRHSSETKFPFEMSPTRFALPAEETTAVRVLYTGRPDDGVVEIPIHFDELTTGESHDLILTGGAEKPKCFPIKSNAASLSWVRAGRKEISLKNILDRRIHMRCQIVGDGFAIDLPGLEARGSYVLPFNANECRPLPIVFTPKSCMPYSATLHIVQDRSNNDSSRKIMLYGCLSGEPVRWSGHVTYSDTAALIRANHRSNIELCLQNKSTMPAFVAAKVHFNLQYMHLEPFCTVRGANSVIAGRALHCMTLQVDWARVGRRAGGATSALATLTVLTGAEATRRRILKILRDEAQGKMDVSLLPEHVRVIAQQFENEDSEMDNLFNEFSETKASLSELIQCGLQELSAHIDLPQQYGTDDTIVISDDTLTDHLTLCE